MSDTAPGTPPYPMPDRLPSLHPSVSPASGCPRHGPLSPYTRNTEGMYASATPSCCGPEGGCYEGIADELNRACSALRILLTDCDLHTTPPNFLRDAEGIPCRIYRRIRRLRRELAEHDPTHHHIPAAINVDCLFHICQHLERYISNFNDSTAWETYNMTGDEAFNPASLLRDTIERTGADRYATDTYIYRLAQTKLTATG
jgi:hypothetical protein